MRLTLPWYITLPIYISLINLLPAYFYYNPYKFFGGLEAIRAPRSKNYSQVRHKKEEDVQVHTDESRKFYGNPENVAKNVNIPLYSQIPDPEQIEEHGLKVIGSIIEGKD
jgi:hypothetical protein